MPKKIIWEFNHSESTLSVSEESKEAENEKAFSFKLTRYKNKETYQESLRIESFYNGAENGYIDTFIYSLDNDLKQLKKYGVAFSGIVYTGLKQEIENVYLSLSPIEPAYDENAPKTVDKIVMKAILEMIGEVVNVFGLDEGYYHIPVEQFNLLIDESEFKEYNITSIKEWLSKNNFIKCGIGRFTNLVRLNQKPTRVISFYADKIKDYPKDDNTATESRQMNE